MEITHRRRRTTSKQRQRQAIPGRPRGLLERPSRGLDHLTISSRYIPPPPKLRSLLVVSLSSRSSSTTDTYLQISREQRAIVASVIAPRQTSRVTAPRRPHSSSVINCSGTPAFVDDNEQRRRPIPPFVAACRYSILIKGVIPTSFRSRLLQRAIEYTTNIRRDSPAQRQLLPL